MNRDVDEWLEEIHQNYIELGADLMILEGVCAGEGRFACGEIGAVCLDRLSDYIEQHSGDIRQLSRFCVKRFAPPPPAVHAAAVRSSRAAAAGAARAVWSKKGSRFGG